jgi:hypothetical protein
MIFSGSENVFYIIKEPKRQHLFTFIMSLDLHGPLGYML